MSYFSNSTGMPTPTAPTNNTAVPGASVFAGMNDAKVFDRLPRLTGKFDYLVRVDELELSVHESNGTAMWIKVTVERSDNPAFPPGTAAQDKITGFSGVPTDQKRARAQTREFLAACKKVNATADRPDPTDPNMTWERAADYAIGPTQVCRGDRLIIQKGAPRMPKSGKGQEYAPSTYVVVPPGM